MYKSLISKPSLREKGARLENPKFLKNGIVSNLQSRKPPLLGGMEGLEF